MRRHILTVIAVWLVAGSGSAQERGTMLTLADLERMALELNPTLAQAQAEIAAAAGRARQAGRLPNPTIGYTAEEVSGGPVIRGGEHGVFFEQTIPLGGKLKLSRQIFEREADRAEAVRDAQRLRVVTLVRTRYYEVLAAARRVELRMDLAALTNEAVDVTRQLLNTGAADLPDLLEAEIEAQRAALDLGAAQNRARQTWQQLAQAVGNPALIAQPLAAAPLPGVDPERTLATILRDSPELHAARAAVDRADTTLRRAKKEPVPDLVLRGGPRYNREALEPDNRPVGWEAFVEVGFTVPLFNRNQGNIAAAAADLTRARREVTRLELTLRSRFAETFETYRTARQEAETYRTAILPRAEQAHALYAARFAEMAAAYPQVLIARRTWLQVNERYVDAVETTWRAAVILRGMLLTDGLAAPTAPGER